MQTTGSLARRHDTRTDELFARLRKEVYVAKKESPEQKAMRSKVKFIRELFQVDLRNKVLRECAREWVHLDSALASGKITQERYDDRVGDFILSLRKTSGRIE